MSPCEHPGLLELLGSSNEYPTPMAVETRSTQRENCVEATRHMRQDDEDDETLGGFSDDEADDSDPSEAENWKICA